MRASSCILPLLALLGNAFSQEAPVPVDQEPHHHIILKNDSVLAMRVTLAPNEATLYHTHSHERMAVHLTANTVASQVPDKPESATQDIDIGSISVAKRGETPLTHRVHNFGPGTFDVIDVEFLQSPSKTTSVPAGKVAAENANARVYNWILAAGASSPQHTHTRPYLIVSVKAMPLKMSGPDGKSLSEQVKPGDYHWVDQQVTHTLTNDGEFEGQIVEIELK